MVINWTKSLSLYFYLFINSGAISRDVSLLSREVTELSLPESLRDSPVVRKSVSPSSRKMLVTQKSDGKLKTRSQSNSPLRRSPSFGSKTPAEAWVTKGPGGIVIPL